MKTKISSLISVVIPVYNGEKYLRQCVESIQNQDYDNIEIIIVDDGSKDSSADIADELVKKNKRIKVIHKKNGGVSSARNEGIKIAKGQYISFVDVDDTISKGFISYLYNLIIKDNLDMALFYQPNRFSGEIDINRDDNTTEKVDIKNGKEVTIDMLNYKIAIGSWGKLIKMSVIKENNIMFNTNLSFGEGFNFSIDCYQKCKKIACSYKKLYNYRLDNPNSVMTKFSLKQINGNLEAQKVIKSKLEKDIDYSKSITYAYWHTCCDCINSIIGTHNQKNYKELYKRIYKDVRKYSPIVFKVAVPKKDKMKGVVYFINPFIAAKLINHFRMRKFTK